MIPISSGRKFFVLALGVLSLGACGDSPTSRVERFELPVDVLYPAGYADVGAEGARVVLRNVERGTADTVTAGPGGRALFRDLVPGSYEISASRSLAPEDVFRLTGHRVELQLNARMQAQRITAATADGPVELRLAGSAVGSWVFKEIYYTGSQRPTGGTYFFDQFYEIYNNSTDTLYAGGLMVVNVFGTSGQINSNSQPTPFHGDEAYIYADEVWRIPGGPQDHPVPPGGSLVIAQQGINHRSDPNGNPGSPVDLGSADWEMFVEASGRDIDSPSVPNLQLVHKRGGFFALFPVFGPGLALARVNGFTAADSVAIPGSSPTTAPVLRIPVGSVIDAVEALQNSGSGNFKRIPAALDAGFVFASGTYTGEGFRRRTARTVLGRRILQDTNNSADDFERISQPQPRGF